MNPRVRPCEPLCGLLRGGAASLPQRGIQSRFRADFRGLSGRRKKQEKRHWRFSAPLPFTASRSAGCHKRLRRCEKGAFFEGARTV